MVSDKLVLKSILDATDELLTLAEAGEWGQLFELEQSRDELIGKFFTSQPEITASLLAEGIRFILDSNKNLTQLYKSRRESLRNEIASAGKAYKVANAYLST